MNALITLDNFKNNEEQMLTDIIESKGDNLPATLDSLIGICAHTKVRAKAWDLYAKSVKNLQGHADMYETAFQSGQRWNEASIYSKIKMGEETEKIPSREDKTSFFDSKTQPIKQDVLKGLNITPGVAWEAESLNKNKEIVEDLLEESREKHYILSEYKIHAEIKKKAAKKATTKAKAKLLDKEVTEDTELVANYFKNVKSLRKKMKLFIDEITLAIAATKQNRFSKESVNMVQTKHDEIISIMENDITPLMRELEGKI